MVKLKRGMNPLLFILIVAVVCVAATALVLYIMGYRYISNDEGYKFIGKTQGGQPMYGTIRYPNGTTAELDYVEKTIRYSNGDIYVGDISQIYRHGKGKMTYYATKDTFEGDYQYDKMTGSGTYTFRNGDKYVGTFVDSKKHGRGVFTWANGSVYDGSFEDDLISGFGIFTLGSDGSRYEGNFKNGVKEGEGEFYFANGDYYKGQFKADKRTGNGFYRWANKQTYTGNLINNVQDTRLLDENGEYILNSDGSFKHGDKAVYTWPSGRSYTGYFENGKPVTVEE